MTPTRYYFALAGLSLLATNCSRKEKIEDCPGQCTVMAGTLLTSSQQPLADAPVSATWKSGQGYSSTVRARTTTDARGNYQLSFYPSDAELQDGYFYVTYEVDKGRYYVIGNTDGPATGPGSLRRDTTYQLPPFLIARKAAIKVTVPNPDQIQSYFSVEFVSAHGHSLTANRQSLGGGEVRGIPKQSTPFVYTAEVAADQKLYVHAIRAVNNTYVRSLDSLVVPAGTTRDLTIRY